MSNTITLTISQLENLLDRQKDLVIEKLEAAVELPDKPYIASTPDTYYLRHDKIWTEGIKADYPHDFNVLKKYIK